jgi:hypothetical protein
MVFNATFNNTSAISWRSVVLLEETGIPGENYRRVTIHRQTLSKKMLHREFELTTLVVIVTECTVSCKSNHHHTITTTTARSI